MKTLVIKSVVGSLLIGALLAGAWKIIDLNRAAMGGAGRDQPAGFYGH
jgi:hypothetical protein